MKSCLLLPVAVVLAAGLLASCSSQSNEDAEAAIGTWSTSEDAKIQNDLSVVAELYSRVNRGSHQQGTAVTTSFDNPLTLGRVELSCYGDGTITGTLAVTTANGSSTIQFPDFRCGDGTQPLDLPQSQLVGVLKLGLSVSDSSRESAWILTARE